MSLSGGGSSNSARGLGVLSDKPQPPPPQPQPQPQPVPAAAAGGAVVPERKPAHRLKREDHVHVKHDGCFSEWKVLVGPTDWKEHAAGKIPDRFRICNLPSNYVGSGLYELGVTPPVWLPPQRSHDFLKPQDVVVVYLGFSDNVHQHLMRCGQSGAHLEGVRSTRLFALKNEKGEPGWRTDVAGERATSFTREHERSLSIENVSSVAGSRPCSNASMEAGDDAAALSTSNQRSSSPYDQLGSLSPRGPRLFSEVFALGCSIAFRWAATDSKAVAEKAEGDLIEIFDYAWKRGGNFRQRSPDILAKIVMGGALGSNDSTYGCLGDRSTKTWFFFQRARAGVHIAARRPGAKEQGSNNNNRSSSSSRTDRSRVSDFFTLFRSSPQFTKSPKSCEFTKLDIPLDRCGAPLESGSPCHALPVKGGKRCLVHKDGGRKVQAPRSGRVAHTNHPSPAHEKQVRESSQSSYIPEGSESPILPGPKPTPASSSCFPYLMTPAVPNRGSSPEPKRRGSLSFTSWLRTSEIRMAKSREWADVQLNSAQQQQQSRRNSSTYSSILATTVEESQSQQSIESPFQTPCMSPSRRQICGLRLDDGTVCPDPPRPDRKRCEAHKGLRNHSPKSPRSSTSLTNPPAGSVPASFF